MPTVTTFDVSAPNAFVGATNKNPLDLDDEEKSSSLSKTIGNAMNLLSDGLYRMKNRNKSE